VVHHRRAAPDRGADDVPVDGLGDAGKQYRGVRHVPGAQDLRWFRAPHDGSTRCYTVNMSTPEITQRDLRSRSREIMDAVEHGQSFTVTRDGHQIGELIPLRRRPRFVSRHEFAAMSRNAPASDLEAFRADQDAAADHEAGSAYDR
jgi:antitoxin (DNA-binding transcriptional repressor) of toxin-antitoxin stability system